MSSQNPRWLRGLLTLHKVVYDYRYLHADQCAVFQPGDVVVAALVDAHDDQDSGLGCGKVIPDRLIHAVAVRYGVDTSASLGNRGVSLGYLIVDVCPGDLLRAVLLFRLAVVFSCFFFCKMLIFC